MKRLFTLLSLVIFAQFTFGQLSGTKNIPGDYADLAAAITDLNTQGVGAGGVTLNLVAGNPQSAPAGGYVVGGTGSLVLTTSSVSNPILFEGNGNTITAATQTAGVQSDAIFKIVGGDWITFQNFILQENSSNTVITPIGSNTMTESGFALYLVTATDGAQNNTLQSNTISLNATYPNAIGILSTSSNTVLNGTLEATATTGSNSSNKIYGNTITNVAYGMYFICPPITATIFETGIDIGGTTSGNGNNITFGNVTTATYTNLNRFSGTLPAGIYFRNGGAGCSVRYNTINSNNLAYAQSGGIGGVVTTIGTAAVGVTYTSTRSNNTITLSNTGTTAITGIDFGYGLSTGTIVSNDNTITINQATSAAASAAIIGIKASFVSATNTDNNNIITVNQSPGTAGALTSAVTGITAAGVGATVNVNNNIITFKQAAPGGTATYGSGAITYIDCGAASGTVNVNSNQLLTAGSTLRSTGTLIGIGHSATISIGTTINLNTFSIDRIATSGTIYGTYETGTPSPVSTTITNNSITYSNLAGTTIVYPIYSLGGASATGTVKALNSNSINVSGTNTGTVIGIQTGYSYGNLNNNTITLNGSAPTIVGIQATASGAGAYTMTGNTLSLTSSTTSPTSMIAINVGTTGPFQIYNNTFSALNFTGIITASPTISGIAVAAGAGNNIYNNTITNISTGAATSSASPVISGILISGGTSTNVYKNKIQGLTTLATGASTLVSGIRISAGTTNYIYNNFISDLNATAVSSIDAIRGINITSTTTSSTIGLYYNTIYLNTSSSGTNFGTSGVFHTTNATATTAALEMRNNIVSNVSTPAGIGITVAYRRSSATLTNYSNNSNANCYYASNPEDATHAIFYDGTTPYSMAGFKTLVSPRDGASFRELPPFLNTTTPPYNLHLNTVSPTQCESGGADITTPIAITTDYDGNTRNSPTPDVGADEFTGTGLDLSAPASTFTALPNAALFTDRTLNVTITDATGVPTSGIGLPVLYWKINAGTYSPATASYISGNQYSFTFGTGVTTGDIVSYYIVAQDAVTPTPNVGANPSGGASGFTIDPPACSTPPTTPYSYTIVPGLAGSYTVGTSGTYATLTGAGGLFADINAKVVTGNITAQIISNITEDGTNALNQWAEDGVGGFTLTIQPDVATERVISGAVANHMIRLNGADRVSIDGRYSGAGKYLRFRNSNTSNSTIQFINAASDNTLRNIYLEGATTGTNGVVFFSTGANTGNDIIDSEIRDQTDISAKPYIGVYFGAIENANNTIVNTKIFNFSNYGLYISAGANTLVDSCEFYMTSASTLSTVYGLYLTYAPGTKIIKNKIYDLNGSSSATVKGVYYFGSTSGTFSISFENNSIALSPVTTGTVDGIDYFGESVNSANIYYNSIFIGGSLSSGTNGSYCIRKRDASANFNIKDNALHNARTNSGGTASHYVIYVSNTTGTFSFNYNDYFSNGTGGVLGYWSATNQVLLSDWQTASTQDANSISTNPQFNTTTNLQPNLGAPVIAAGNPIGGITTDILNVSRSGSSPSIGAYEIGADASGPAIVYTALANTSSTSNRAFTNVTMTDPSGVNTTSGTNPRVYYKRSTDANTFNDNTSGTDGWKYAETSSGSSPFSFTIDYSLLNGGTGVIVGTIVQYFVVAQDLQGTPFVSINSGTFAATPVSVALTAGAFPIGGTINSYFIAAAFSGTIPVGTGQTYTSLTADATTGLFKAINGGVITGNVIVSVVSDLTETGAIALNQWSEEGAGNYTLTVAPDGSTLRTASGSYTGGLIRLNGADRVTFDGDFVSMSGNKYLAFTNTATTGTIAAIQVISLGNAAGANNVTIKYCNISTGLNTNTASYGISVGGTTVASAGSDNDYLTIRYCTIFKAYTGLFLSGNSTGISDNLSISNNIFGSGTSSDYLGNIGVSLQQCSGAFGQNEIYNVTTGNNPKALVIGTGVINSTFSRNNIHGIRYTGIGGYGGKGIDINTGSASSNLVFDNNQLYDIFGDGWSTFSSDAIVGIRILGTTGGLKFYFNSINLFGSMSRSGATADKSAAIYIVSTATAIELKDNIFINKIENTTGVATAYAIYSDAVNTAFSSINYNDYYVSGAEGVLGFLGANQATLGAWQTATGQDANSVNVNPIFASNTDLRIDLSSPMIGIGTPITGVDYDYANTDRSNTAPSIGAFETGGDYSGPIISYTTLGNTASLANRAFTNVVITDGSGVNVTPGTNPRVYYKRSSDGNVWNDNTSGTDGWKYAEANGVSSPFDFTINYALLNGGTGVVAGNVVQYFVVAQDLQGTPLVSINSGTFAALPASVALTTAAFPISGTINSYNIAALLSGTVTVGSLGTYLNLTGPSGLFKAINDNVLSGNLTVLINSNLTEEGTNALNQWAEVGVGGYTVTIKPNAAVIAIVTGALASSPLIRLNGVSRVVIDGSNNGTTTRDLTITNTSATSPNVLRIGSIGTTTISDVTVKNCILTNGSTSTTALLVTDVVANGSGYFDNITIQNNDIRQANTGAYINAVTGEGTNVSIINNILNSTGTSNIRYMGFYLQGIDNGIISGNMIGNFDKATDENDHGMWIASGCTNLDIFDNKIDNLGYTGINGYGAHGIYLSTGLANADINIFNNLISNISGDGDDYITSNIYNPTGIYMFTTQTGINVYNNSIYLTGNTLNYAANAMSIGIFVGTGTAADIRNNIIENNLGLLGAVGYGACGIYAETSAAQFSTINNNAYYINPTGSGVKAIGKIGAATTATTIAAWQIATGQDTKSINADPLYISTTDLHLQSGSPAIGKGTPLTLVTDDYAGTLRHLFKPTIGAYEYAPLNFYMWTGLFDNNWNDAGNWSPLTVPGGTDDAGIPADPTSNPNVFPVVPAGTFSVDELFIAPGATITIPNGATLNVTNTNP